MMRVKTNCLLVVLPLTLLIAWGEVNHAKSIPNEVQVAGTWDAQFEGTVEGKGTRQDDSIIMELKQKGSKVTGIARVHGLDLKLQISGEVAGTTFTYTIKGMLNPNCEASIFATTTVEAGSGKFKGSQTQTTCEGTARGQVTAVRR